MSKLYVIKLNNIVNTYKILVSNYKPVLPKSYTILSIVESKEYSDDIIALEMDLNFPYITFINNTLSKDTYYSLIRLIKALRFHYGL